MLYSIMRLMLLIACVTHLAGCVWWYLGVVDLDGLVGNNYAELAAGIALGESGVPDASAHGDRRLVATSTANSEVSKGDAPPINEVYLPSGRAVLDLWIFYYQGLGEEDIWLDRHVTGPRLN
jgi:hypothetical protein